MQNVQFLTSSCGLNNYICKYIAKIDEHNHVIIRSNPYDKGVLIYQSTFTHNTKITSSAINETHHLKSRGKSHPKGRATSLMEIFQFMLNYHHIHTEIIFENVPTIALEQRAGM